jgi:hypothetical protein
MQIFVKAQDGSVLTIEIEGADSVADLKALVCEKSGAETDDVRLLFERQTLVVEELKDAKTVRECGVQKESELRMVVVAGGAAGGPLTVASRATGLAFESLEDL